MKNPAKQLMTDHVFSVHPDTIMSEVKEIFDTNPIHHIPVVDDQNKVVGIISKLDYHVLLDHFTLFSCEVAEKRNKKFFSTLLVKEVMTKNVSVIQANESLEVVIKTFLENLFHALPVVEHERLIGIITSHDVIKYLYEKEFILAIE